jgi:hypothetical protein
MLPNRFKLAAAFVLAAILADSSASMATNQCNYWYLYVYNQNSDTMSYALVNIPDGGIVGGDEQNGKIPPGGSVYFYFGNQNSGKQVYAGGTVKLTSSSGATVGEIDASASDSNGCFFDAAARFTSPYTGCGRFNQGSSPSACTSPCMSTASASDNGEGNSNLNSQVKAPNAAFTICK